MAICVGSRTLPAILSLSSILVKLRLERGEEFLSLFPCSFAEGHAKVWPVNASTPATNGSVEWSRFAESAF